MRRSFRFRPRYRGLAFGAIAIGAALALGGVIAALWALIIAGLLGVVLGVLYLQSPAWRIAVRVDDEAPEVPSRGDRRFRLAWAEIKEVVASPSTSTCFVDGGDPAQSLLVPGPGAPAPYAIEERGDLYTAITERVPHERIREVALLEKA